MSEPTTPRAATEGPYWQVVHTDAGFHIVAKGGNHERIVWSEVYVTAAAALDAIRVTIEAGCPDLDVVVGKDTVSIAQPRIAPEAPRDIIAWTQIYHVDERTGTAS